MIRCSCARPSCDAGCAPASGSRQKSGSNGSRRLKSAAAPADDSFMDSVSGSNLDAGAVYGVLMLRRAQNMQRQAGENAVRLIDAAQVPQTGRDKPAPLPADATFSVRV